MDKNFTLYGFAEIHVEGAAIDIHNLYRAVSISTDLSGRSASLAFERDHEQSSALKLPERVIIICTDDGGVAFNDLAQPLLLSENCVDLGYYSSECEWDSLLDEELAARQGCQGLAFMFDGGLVLRVRCRKARVSTSG